jgi:hypothetical protein
VNLIAIGERADVLEHRNFVALVRLRALVSGAARVGARDVKRGDLRIFGTSVPFTGMRILS